MSKSQGVWLVYPTVWMLAVSLVLTPYAFGQGLADESSSAEFEAGGQMLLAQEDTPEPSAAADSAPAEQAASEPEAAPAEQAASEPETAPAEQAVTEPEAPSEPSGEPASAEQALREDGAPSLVSPEQIGEGEAQAADSAAPAAGTGPEPLSEKLKRVPWWAWAAGGVAILLLASLAGGGGGGGGGPAGDDPNDDSEGGTVGYTW